MTQRINCPPLRPQSGKRIKSDQFCIIQSTQTTTLNRSEKEKRRKKTKKKKKKEEEKKMVLPQRTASISRTTNETKIQISLSLDGGVLPAYEPSSHFAPPADPSQAEAAKTGIIPEPGAEHATQFTATQQVTVSTGIGFLDHMLHALAKHSGWSLAIRARGDLYSTCLSSFLIQVARGRGEGEDRGQA